MAYHPKTVLWPIILEGYIIKWILSLVILKGIMTCHPKRVSWILKVSWPCHPKRVSWSVILKYHFKFVLP